MQDRLKDREGVIALALELSADYSGGFQESSRFTGYDHQLDWALDTIAGHGLGDDKASNAGGDWVIRVGRFLLRGNSQGFVWGSCERTVGVAVGAMAVFHHKWEGSDDDC